MKGSTYVVDPDDPRAPPREVWDSMSEEARRRVVASLPSFAGAAPLPHARELIDRLTSLVDDAVTRAEQEAMRAEQEASRAEQERTRADEAAERAARFAAKLRELGVDPDSLE